MLKGKEGLFSWRTRPYQKATLDAVAVEDVEAGDEDRGAEAWARPYPYAHPDRVHGLEDGRDHDRTPSSEPGTAGTAAVAAAAVGVGVAAAAADGGGDEAYAEDVRVPEPSDAVLRPD